MAAFVPSEELCVRMLGKTGPEWRESLEAYTHTSVASYSNKKIKSELLTSMGFMTIVCSTVGINMKQRAIRGTAAQE